MQGWQIAALVIIVVAFVALAVPLVLFIYRLGTCRRLRLSGRTKTISSRYVESIVRTQDDISDAGDAFSRLHRGDPRIHPSTHLLYFLDFQGKLHWIDFRKKPASEIDTESAMQQYIFETFQPTVEESNRMVYLPPETLALSYVNEHQRVVVMDLNRLLARDATFGARMLHTAERPLLLSRLVADDANGAVFTPLSRYGYTVGDAAVVPVTQSSMQYPALVAPSSPKQHQQCIEVDISESRANPMSMGPAVSAPMSSTPVPPPQPSLSNLKSAYVFDSSGMAPAPVIHPCDTHHITASTLVSITAASYTVLDANGTRTELDATNTALIEKARLRWDRRQRLVVPLVSGVLAGHQCVIDPVTEAVALFRSPAALATQVNGVHPVVCQRADALYYTVERVNSTQWLPFDKPFCLPAGRWCVQARSMLYSDDSSKTIAKVFTVTVL
ncbi:hypothetical protein LPMP_352510 [Leishmania panamensis]|uniref:Uncharacterized protein n=1 Tax=Leishmania panamensis TaxID=5679 RepID=A0A088S1V6_LEIPA|nr:hypothetical protein LPMP_352510 [Leishmania panamensis]AIO02388.1 hypothetical protein LPMP_352510 [Leishmania panamensis]